MCGVVKIILTSLFHAEILLVLSSALPVSPSNNTPPLGQTRSVLKFIQPGPVVAGLLLYATGVGVVRYVVTVAGNRRENKE